MSERCRRRRAHQLPPRAGPGWQYGHLVARRPAPSRPSPRSRRTNPGRVSKRGRRRLESQARPRRRLARANAFRPSVSGVALSDHWTSPAQYPARLEPRPSLAAGCRPFTAVTALSPVGNRLPASWPPINQRGSRRGGRSLTQEAVMGQPIPAQHPSAVLRSHSNLVRALLIIAMAALLACTAAVVILANDEDQISTATQATPHGASSVAAPGRHALRRRPRRGHPRSVSAAPAPGRRSLRRWPRRGLARRDVLLRLAQPAVQLSASSGRQPQGPRRWPHDDPAGSRRQLELE